MQGSSAKEWWHSVLMVIEVGGDLSVSVCGLGLTIVALVVVEIWSEVFPLWEIWWIMWGMVRSAREWWYGHVTLLGILIS
jgi:hypothetical protein